MKRAGWIVAGVMLCVTTLSISTALADVSNIVRYTCLAASLAVVTLMSLRHRITIPMNIGTLSAVLLVVLEIVSVMWAPNKAEAIFEAAKWIITLTAIVIIYNLVRSHPARFVVFMSRVSLAVTAVAMTVAAVQLSKTGDLTWSSRYAIVSLFSHKGTFSLMLLLAMAFPLMRLQLHIRRGRIIYFILLLLQMLMIVFLQARAAWIAVVAVAATLLAAKLSGRVRILYRWYWVVALALIAGLVTVGVSRHFADMDIGMPDQRGGLAANASIHERQSLWRMTLKMVDKHPVSGCGTGNWKVCYGEASVGDVFSIDVLDFNFVRPHNEYLRLLAETGYPSLVLFLLAVSSVLVTPAGSRNRYRHGKAAHTSLAFFVGIMFFAFFDFPFDRTETLLWTAILCAATIGFSRITSRDVAVPKAVTIATCVAMVLCLSVGISRWRSEKHFAYIVNGIHNRQWQEVEVHCHEARTPLCNLSSLGMPLAYYEGMAMEYQHKPAYSTFQEALKDSPYCKQVLNDLGRLEYTQNHDVAKAETMLNEAIRISPSYSYAYLNLAQLYMQEKRYNEAIETLQRLDLDKKQEMMRRMVWHYHQGDVADYYSNQQIDTERKAVQRIIDYARKQSEQ